jgi:hypothetical protein
MATPLEVFTGGPSEPPVTATEPPPLPTALYSYSASQRCPVVLGFVSTLFGLALWFRPIRREYRRRDYCAAI